MKSIYDYMLKSFKQGLKAAQADSGHVTITVKTELPVDDNRPLTAQFRKLNPNVRLPERNGAAWDLYLPEDVTIEAGQTVKIKLGFACKLPNGYSAFILMRSSTWGKWGICLGNQLGLWDGDYGGNEDELGLICYRPNSYKDYPTVIPAGTRIAQFIIFKNPPNLNFEVVESLPDSSRGGFGSTGE